MNATLDDNNYTSTSCKPFATTTTTTSIHDNNDINQSIQDNSQYEETVALQQLKQKLENTPNDAKSSLVHAQKGDWQITLSQRSPKVHFGLF